MAKAVKLADIAGQLGVSTVTVSKALSGQKGVSEELREKIKTLADEMGYKQPSASGKPWACHWPLLQALRQWPHCGTAVSESLSVPVDRKSVV